MKMNTNRIFCIVTFLVAMLAAAKIVFHLSIWFVPLIFFSAGLTASAIKPKYGFYLFLFLLPFINSTPGLENAEYAFNSIAPSLFLLLGIALVPLLRDIVKPGGPDRLPVFRGPEGYYLVFLLFLLLSAAFLFLRWSNVTVPGLAAFGSDTQVSPGVRSQRISFATIFPVITLFLYFMSPYAMAIARKIKAPEKQVFSWLSYGLYLSVAIAVYQWITGSSLISDRLGKEFKQFNGGGSDFNSFGFFCGVMFIWSTYEIKKKNPTGYLTFFISLAGGILSGSRSVFIFVVMGLIHLLLAFKKDKKANRTAVIAIIIVAVVFTVIAGGTLTKRLSEGYTGGQDLFERINSMTNGRLWMNLFTLRAIKDSVLCGIGAGNFTFYLDYKNYGEDYLYDLPLNHYTLVFAELGLFAFLAFTAFLLTAYRRSKRKILLGTILFSLLLNNFFWFPEAFLLFWIILAMEKVEENEEPAVGPEKNRAGFLQAVTHRKAIILPVAVLIFFAANMIGFKGLHPRSWAVEHRAPYDYGFWYQEKDESGGSFRWTMGTAGTYLRLDEKGESPQFTIFCGAPLQHLTPKGQKVSLYWKGKLFRRFTFTENRRETFKIKKAPYGEGFLEIRSEPAFNLEKMGLGEETRELGVKLYIYPGDQLPR